MARAPIQILVIPYFKHSESSIEYAIFKRSDEHYWQFIAGGAEDNETPLEAAKRESYEEAEISPGSKYTELESFDKIPVVGVRGFLWGEDVCVIPQYCFAVEANNQSLKISAEHTEYIWGDYNTVYNLLHWNSNKNALWELNYKLENKKI
jgi:dATP pyrophosphohydrolase